MVSCHLKLGVIPTFTCIDLDRKPERYKSVLGTIASSKMALHYQAPSSLVEASLISADEFNKIPHVHVQETLAPDILMAIAAIFQSHASAIAELMLRLSLLMSLKNSMTLKNRSDKRLLDVYVRDVIELI